MSDHEHDHRERVLDPERDAAALKALTHPLRIRLLGLLRQDGPATASELAARTGESSASTSYHLRVLAKYGFVAEAEHRDARERRWRSVHEVTSWDNQAMAATPASREFVSVVRRQQIARLEQAIVEHEADLAAGRLGAEWAAPSGMSDFLPRLTPESLTELWETIERTTEELTARDQDDPRARQIVLVAGGFACAPRDTGRPAGDAGGRPQDGTQDGSEDGAERTGREDAS